MELFFLQVKVFGVVLGLFLILLAIAAVCFFVAQKPRGMPWYKFCAQLGIIELYEHFDQKAYDKWVAAKRKLSGKKTPHWSLASKMSKNMFTTVRCRVHLSKILALFK